MQEVIGRRFLDKEVRDGLLLAPGNHRCPRQIADPQWKAFEGDRDLNREQASLRWPMSPGVFAAGKRENQSILGPGFAPSQPAAGEEVGSICS